MKRSSARLLAAILAAPTFSCAQDVTIRVYNYARTDRGIVEGALRLSARILDRTGVTTAWIDCAVSTDQAGRNLRCGAPLAGTDIVLKLLPDMMARKLEQTAETVGLAVPTPPAGLGTAFIFVKQAEQLAFGGPFPAGHDVARTVMLGHVIAHEIGHLLLGPGNHSSSGIMSFPWSEKVLRRIATAHLSFTDQEARLVRKRLAESRPPHVAAR